MPVSYANDIRSLFTQIDIDHMSFFCNLADYDEVKTNADDILGRLDGSGGPVMPPASAGGPSSAGNIALFTQWIADGCQP